MGVMRNMKPAIRRRSILAAGVLGLALAAILSVQAQAAERMVLAEYFTSNY
jgi:hypothetical protein